jgi:CheY-like chemotaxis protein
MNADQYVLLVVDDNDMNRDLLSRRLERKGYCVQTAADGLQALELVGNGSIDLVLLDIMMPGMTGIEVLRALREHSSASELPVIMVSAKGESEDVVQALELGANDYVTKPIDFLILLARVQSQLRMRATVKAGGAAGPGATPAEVGPSTIIAGKYLLESKLGSGSFGAVYRARHISLDNPVALKILQCSVMPSAEAVARFQQEGISACRINHPNAVSVIDFGVTATGVAYLVMELLEGASLLEELCDKGPMSVSRVGEILLPICDVLAKAHLAGIIHRDIKPPNIFLHRGRTGEIVKVLDFGIAKLVGDAAGSEYMTLEGDLLGTPAYMAPERLSNRPYDGRADVYAVGIMTYQMLTGQLPFIGADPMAIAMQHMNAAPPPLRDHLPDLPAAVESVVMQALAKNPAERPTAAEFARLFADAASGAGASIMTAAQRLISADELPTLASADLQAPPGERKPQD